MLHILFIVSLFSSQGPGGLAATVSSEITSSLFTLTSSLQAKPAVVGSNGLEPSTSRLSGVRSNHLSYEPISVAVRLPSGQTIASGLVLTPFRDYQTDDYRNLIRDVAPATCRWWRRTESNCRPPACKAGALPAELRPRIRFVPSGESTLLSSRKGPQN